MDNRRARVGEGAGLCFSVSSQAMLKVKAYAVWENHVSERLKGSCAREGV